MEIDGFRGFESVLWRLCSCGVDVNAEAMPSEQSDEPVENEFLEDVYKR